MKAIGFEVVEATNPNTGEVIKKVRVKFNTLKALTFLTDLTVEEIKAQRDSILSRIEVRNGEHGEYCVISRSTLIESF